MPKFKEIRERLRKADQLAADLQAISALIQSKVGKINTSKDKAIESQKPLKQSEPAIENMRNTTEILLR